MILLHGPASAEHTMKKRATQTSIITHPNPTTEANEEKDKIIATLYTVS